MSGYGSADDSQINAYEIINNNIELIRMLLPTGLSSNYCFECGDEIPKARMEALPGVKYCIQCQTERDKIRPKLKVVTKML